MKDNRAEQYMPFASLRGFEDFLSEKESVTERRRELSEDEAEVLSRKIKRVKAGDSVTVEYYDCAEGKSAVFEGVVKKADLELRELVFEDRTLPFCDIYDIGGRGIDEE